MTRDLTDEEELILSEFQDAKKRGYADILISIDKGELAKVYTTKKLAGDDLRRNVRKLKEGAAHA